MGPMADRLMPMHRAYVLEKFCEIWGSPRPITRERISPRWLHPKNLGAQGAVMSEVGGKAEVDFGRLDVCL